MTDDEQPKPSQTSSDTEFAYDPFSESGEAPVRGLPASAQLPVEVLLQLPPPTPPRVEAPPEQVEEVAEESPSRASVAGEKLREALMRSPEAIGVLRDMSPRNVAKNTVERGIDAAFAYPAQMRGQPPQE